MTSGQFRRARSQETKLQRRQSLLDAAASLLRERDFGAIRMDDIARQAGVAKGTLYLYFRQREDVFLTLAFEGLTAVLERIEVELRSDLSIRGPDRVAAAITSAFVGNPTLTRLLNAVPALQEAARSNAESESRAALTVCSRRVDALVAERLYGGPGRSTVSPVSLVMLVLLGAGQLSALGISPAGYQQQDEKMSPRRLLAALFRA